MTAKQRSLWVTLSYVFRFVLVLQPKELHKAYILVLWPRSNILMILLALVLREGMVDENLQV